MTQGDLIELVAALTTSLGVFLLVLVIGCALAGLGAALLVIGMYLAYVAQFMTKPLRSSE